MVNSAEKNYSNNFYAFLWHAGFLALAQNFMDVDTIIPAMLVEAGGNAFHVGIMTAIMLGGSSFTQLFFAPYLSNRPFKKNYLLGGINLRVFSLIALGFILFLNRGSSTAVLSFIFLFITIFSLSGAFANISYIDIIGKAVDPKKRKKLFSSRQIISGTAVLASAFLAKELITSTSFPLNYSYSFFIGGLLLLIASGGFWKIKETTPSGLKIKGTKEFLATLKSELKQNNKLIYFLGFINTQGIAISFMPFILLYAKETLNATSSDTGNFLISKVIGVVAVSIIVLILSSKVKYKLLLYLNVFLSVSLASIALFIDDITIVHYLFILGGIIFSLYNITMNGILLEVSGLENRALYAGFAGAGNILPALFPLIGGWIIQEWGFISFFSVFILIVSGALYFIYKMRCTK